MKEEIQSVKMKPGFTPRVVMQPVYEASIRSQKERGGSASGIDADGPLTGMSPTQFPPLLKKIARHETTLTFTD